jgi:hypothetical protein
MTNINKLLFSMDEVVKRLLIKFNISNKLVKVLEKWFKCNLLEFQDAITFMIMILLLWKVYFVIFTFGHAPSFLTNIYVMAFAFFHHLNVKDTLY